MITPEDEVQVARHKKELERIRQEHDTTSENRSDGRFAEVRVGGGGPDEGRNTELVEGTTGRTEGTGEIDRPAKRLRSRIRPSERETVNTTKSSSSDDSPIQETVKRGFSFPFGKGEKKEPDPIQLVSEEEANERREHLISVYQFLSDLPDDFLEIVVKDHEPVQIWHLSEEEAEMLVDIKLRQAKTDPKAAREVRKLLDIYDRMYQMMLLWPRMVATGRHVLEHKGFSFK